MKNKLKLIAPVRSLFMLKQMLTARVDEVYVGLKPDCMEVLSFDSRFQKVSDVPSQVETDQELEEIVRAAHAAGKPVGFMANAYYVPKSLEDAFVRHVRRGVAAGVDSVTVSSLNAVHVLRQHGIEIPIEIGTLMAATNSGYLHMLKELGVTRVLVPQGMLLEEIQELAKETDLELIVTGNFGGGHVCGHCRMSECPTQESIGQGCRSGYRVELPDGSVQEQLTVLDGATDCSLCSIPDLAGAGVSAMKLMGREVPNPITTSKIAEIFRHWMDETVVGGRTSQELYEEMDMGDMMWTMMWKPRFCEKQRCSYLETPTTRAYV